MIRAVSHQCAAAAFLLALAVSPLRSQIGPPTSVPETVTLAYAPEDATLYEISRTVQTTTATGEVTTRDTWERLSRLLVTCTDEGYSNTATVLSQTLARNGTAVPSPVHAAMEGLRLTYTLGKDGIISAVSGYDQLPVAMSEKLAPPLASTMSALLNLAALQQRDENDYRELYRGVLGAEMQVGVPVAAAESVHLPDGGHVTAYSVSTLERIEGDGGALRLAKLLSTDAVALANAFEGIDQATLEARASEAGLATMLPEGVASATVTGEDVAEIDLTGLLIGKRDASLAFTLVPNAGEGETPVPVTVTEASTFAATRVEQVPAPEVPPT